MRELIERLKEIKTQYGDKAFLQQYKPSQGYYFKIDNNGNITYQVAYTGESDDTFLNCDEGIFFRDRLFFETALSSNKFIDAGLKKIQSVTPYSMIFKYGIFNDEKLAKNVEKRIGKNIGKDSFKVAIKDHITKLMELEEISDFEYLSDIYIKLFEFIRDNFVNCNKDDKFLIFFDKDVNEYKKYYKKYLEKKIFLKDETVINVNNEKYGVPTFSISLNTDKPTLSKNPYNKFPYRVNLEETILLNYLTKINMNKINDILSDEDSDLITDIYMVLNKSTKAKEILEYNMSNISYSNEETIPVCSIINSNFTEEKSKDISVDREKILNKIQYYFELDRENKQYLFNELFKIKNGEYKDFIKKCKTNDVAQILISNKDILLYYFKKNGDIQIDKQMIQIMQLLFHKIFFEKEKNNKSEEKSKNKQSNKKFRYLADCLDWMITSLNFLNKEGGYFEMASTIKNIWDKLYKSRKQKDEVYNIESDGEFFFVAGQLLYYLSIQSKSANETSLKLQDVLDIKTSCEAKHKAIEKYKQYAYCLSIHSQNFTNVLYTAIMNYKIDEDIKIKDFKNQFYYQSGLIGKNILLLKKEELTDNNSITDNNSNDINNKENLNLQEEKNNENE